MQKIGYARVSTTSQNLDRQIAVLRAEGCAEKASGTSTGGRPQLERAIDALGTGDVLVVAEWDRATRSMQLSSIVCNVFGWPHQVRAEISPHCKSCPADSNPPFSTAIRKCEGGR
jgi:hypothetical protein